MLESSSATVDENTTTATSPYSVNVNKKSSPSSPSQPPHSIISPSDNCLSLDSIEMQEMNNQLRLLTMEYQTKLTEAPEIKHEAELYRVLIEAIRRPVDDIDGLVYFAQVQRFSIKSSIRSVVHKLTPSEARIALLRFLDNRLSTGFMFHSVNPLSRQNWVKEIIRTFPQEALSVELKKEFNQLEKKTYETIANRGAMEKFYGRLTTVLDQQYRQKLKQKEDLNQFFVYKQQQPNDDQSIQNNEEEEDSTEPNDEREEEEDEEEEEELEENEDDLDKYTETESENEEFIRRR